MRSVVHRLSFPRLHQFYSRIVLVFIFSTIIFSVKSFADANPANGKKLFKQYCTQCHKDAPFDKALVGPPLADIQKKQSEEWLIQWIRNNAALRGTGDKAALAIWNEYHKTDMPQFASFTDDDIKSILGYIANPIVDGGGNNKQPLNHVPEGPSVWLYLVVIALIVIIIMLLRANKALKRMSLERAGQPIPEEVPWTKRLRSTKAIFLYALILVFLLGWTMTDSAIRLGHSKNYQPVQPIAFSHKLHAGINQINCLYCHAGAEKSKTAGIPPVSTCMNCHKGVQAGQSDAGTAEIQKIYAAYNNNKPLQWIKIHNLPDHVYFNHSQHVVVGKVACQTCHGPVQEMNQVYQFASLSMGWCINCHRQTEVQFSKNGFYSMYAGLQEQLKKDSVLYPGDSTKLKMTEARMGGTECQRCHY
ncbi:MAG TPA: c-type cytochrome [Chitinophagales bacterium]|nr:c-type cytochrome [Chitinophagales bacterium]